jgi:hypothetical protein
MRVAQHLRVQKVDVMVRMVPSDTKNGSKQLLGERTRRHEEQ